MNLYRGLSAPVWAERLKAAGWPDVAAEELAEFLVGERIEPPEYRRATSEPFDGLSELDLARILFVAMKGSGGDPYFNMRWETENLVAAIDGNLDLIALGRYIRTAARQEADYWRRRQDLRDKREDIE